MNSAERNAAAQKTFLITFIVNLLLTFFKFAAAVLGNSAAMLSDAVHTLTDLCTTLIGMAGVKIASKEKDASHPYGHERIESLASLLLAAALFAAAFGIGKQGIQGLINDNADFQTPGFIALTAAALSIVTQEIMYQYAARTAKKLNSSALLADAYHHRSDAFSSIGALLGIMLSRFGVHYADSLASIIICCFIFYSALKILKKAVDELIDSSAPEDKLDQIKQKILSVNGVLAIDDIKSRRHASRLYIDAEIAINENETFSKAHEICENVHALLEECFPEIIHCTVHANPRKL